MLDRKEKKPEHSKQINFKFEKQTIIQLIGNEIFRLFVDLFLSISLSYESSGINLHENWILDFNELI